MRGSSAVSRSSCFCVLFAPLFDQSLRQPDEPVCERKQQDRVEEIETSMKHRQSHTVDMGRSHRRFKQEEQGEHHTEEERTDRVEQQMDHRCLLRM